MIITGSMQKHIQSPVNQKALIAYSQANKSFAAALKLAVKAFDKDKRPFTGLAYVSHTMTVCSLLLEVQADQQTMAVAALQDVLRKPFVTEKQLETDFGTAVLAQVKALQLDANLESFGAAVHKEAGSVQTILVASLLDEVCSIPKKQIKTTQALELASRAATLSPYLAAAHPELRRRLDVLLHKLTLDGVL